MGPLEDIDGNTYAWLMEREREEQEQEEVCDDEELWERQERSD